VLVAAISTFVCVLLGTAAAVSGRSLAFGLGAALSFFPADNFGTIVMLLVNRITNQRFFLDITGILLGPNLNVLAVGMQTDHKARAAFTGPLVNVDGTHSLVVIAIFSGAFLLLAVLLMWRRDVLE
jgi:hypothetical protein